MVISTTIKTYLAIFLIGVIVVIAGISVYGIYQRDISQTPTKIYNGLTEAEEEIVKENIKSKVQQQKRMETERVDKKQPSHVDNTSRYDKNQDYQPENIPEASAPIVTKAEALGTETSGKQFKSDSMHANTDNFDEMLKQFAPKDFDKGNGKFVEITSKDDLKKVMADLKASGFLNKNNIIEIKKNTNIGDSKWIEVEIDDK